MLQSRSQFSDHDSRLDIGSTRFSSKCKRNAPTRRNWKTRERDRDRDRQTERSMFEDNNLLTKLRGINCITTILAFRFAFLSRLTLHNCFFPYNWIPSGTIASNSTDAFYRRLSVTSHCKFRIEFRNTDRSTQPSSNLNCRCRLRLLSTTTNKQVTERLIRDSHPSKFLDGLERKSSSRKFPLSLLETSKITRYSVTDSHRRRVEM